MMANFQPIATSFENLCEKKQKKLKQQLDRLNNATLGTKTKKLRYWLTEAKPFVRKRPIEDAKACQQRKSKKQYQDNRVHKLQKSKENNAKPEVQKRNAKCLEDQKKFYTDNSQLETPKGYLGRGLAAKKFYADNPQLKTPNHLKPGGMTKWYEERPHLKKPKSYRDDYVAPGKCEGAHTDDVEALNGADFDNEVMQRFRIQRKSWGTGGPEITWLVCNDKRLDNRQGNCISRVLPLLERKYPEGATVNIVQTTPFLSQKGVSLLSINFDLFFYKTFLQYLKYILPCLKKSQVIFASGGQLPRKQFYSPNQAAPNRWVFLGVQLGVIKYCLDNFESLTEVITLGLARTNSIPWHPVAAIHFASNNPGSKLSLKTHDKLEVEKIHNHIAKEMESVSKRFC